MNPFHTVKGGVPSKNEKANTEQPLYFYLCKLCICSPTYFYNGIFNIDV